jgi:UDP-N-acetylglucosamine--dolichyl-phosphate N-acetylglucosaminephosphotransferase
VVGLLDDIFTLRQRYKPFMVAAMSIPISIALFSRSEVNFPLIGHVPFGLLYPLIVVPLSVTTSANLTNMLAGFNGLEAGCASIALAALTALSAWEGNATGTVLGGLFLSGFLGFLLLNRYPAKIFPGDTGTLMAGAGIAAIGVISGLEFAAVVVSIPAAFDFALKMLTRSPFAARSIHGNTAVMADGTLVPADYPALSHAFLRLSKMSERGLVESIIAMEVVYAILAIVITVSI